jgi:IPT/TIG domain-containing protein
MIAAALLLSISITSVMPSSGPTSGGTTVLLRGTGLGAANPRAVSFGLTNRNLPAESFNVIDSDTIQAVTPPYFPGPVAVTVAFAGGDGSVLPNAFTYTGDVGDGFDRILLPLFVPSVPGAFGSQFVTSFSMWNTAGADIPVFAFSAPPCQILCPPFHDPLLMFLKAREGAPASIFQFDGDPGRLIYVPKGAFDRLAASLRVVDLSRSSQSAGTRVPIVPEREFRSDFLALIDIPTTANFRSTLRVYALDPQTSVHVRVIRYDSTKVISEFDADLREPIDMFHPGYVQLSDFQIEDHARFEIEPKTPGKRIWAFVSVTNNDTQQITVVAPH